VTWGTFQTWQLSFGLFSAIQGDEKVKCARMPVMSDRGLKNLFQSGDIVTAFTLLSRLPLPGDHDAGADRAANSVWAYPLVGAALGGLAALGAKLALLFGAPPGITAALALALLVLLSGALHEDGLADSADGLGGGKDRETRLAIMRDSRIGAFGAVALGVALMARWSGLSDLAEAGALFWPLVAVGAASRLPMVLAMFLMPSARRDGLSAAVGMPPVATVFAALGITFLLGLFALGFGVLPLLFWVLVAPLPLFWLAAKKIGGQTGDILGASQQLAEIAGLAVVVALSTP
jgi:adenosylcobinamide-GDP ribazoletransferase